MKLKSIHFIILGIVLGLGGFFLIIANPFGLKIPRPYFFIGKPTTYKGPPGSIPAPTPTLILPSGKQTFYVRGGEQDFSKISQVTIDPLDADKGDKQSLEVVIDSIEPVSKFNILLSTDTIITTLTPTLKSGNSTRGTWSITHNFPDTALKIYKLTFNMTTNTNKETTIPFMVR